MIIEDYSSSVTNLHYTITSPYSSTSQTNNIIFGHEALSQNKSTISQNVASNKAFLNCIAAVVAFDVYLPIVGASRRPSTKPASVNSKDSRQQDLRILSSSVQVLSLAPRCANVAPLRRKRPASRRRLVSEQNLRLLRSSGNGKGATKL
jgi:hypothetical protein